MEIDQDQAVMVSADKVVVSDFMGNIEIGRASCRERVYVLV